MQSDGYPEWQRGGGEAVILWLSRILVPLVVSYIVGFGLVSNRPVFDDFLAGAKNGMKAIVEILPTLIGLITAVGVLRTSGLLDAISEWLSVPAGILHFPAELVPITIVRLISNSAAIGLLVDIFKEHGPDSPAAMAASVMLGSTETVFYCISIYFGSIHITKTRYTIPGALFATAAGVGAAVFLFMRTG